MNYSNHRISLDIHDTASQVSIAVKRYDNQNRICAFLTEGGKPFTISADCTAVFTAKKPDGTAIYVDATIEENTIIHVMDSNTTACVGRTECELLLLGKDGETITGPRFTVVIEDRVVSDDDVINSTNDFSALSKLVSKGNALVDDVETRLANGEFDGEDGYTPIKGVDYYNEADKKEMHNELASDLSHFANAFKGSASGEAVVVGDVSPVEHTAKVLVHSKNLNIDPSTVTVTACGKNLVDASAMVNNQLVDNGNGTFTLTKTAPESRKGKPIDVFIPSGSAVTFSAKVLSNTSNANLYLVFERVDKSTEEIIITETSAMSKVLTRECVKVWISLAYAAADGTNITFSDLQLEMGAIGTKYEPHKGSVAYTPATDGTVEITSVYPTMTLLTDTEGAIIECEYNRDANKVVADLISFVTQGGASRISYIDLPASKWQDEEQDDLYSQVVSISGVTENSKIDLNPSVEQLAIFHEKDIAFVTVNEDGVVTVYCIGQKPLLDYTMQITITEVISNG